MSSSCTDSTNTVYQLYWYNYFVSIGYIDSTINLNAPYGKCTTSLLWITYLINIIHFFVLTCGILYLIKFHRDKIGFWWPCITWIVSFIFFILAVVIFIIRNLSLTIFSILIIGFQVSVLIILWFSIFVIIAFNFKIDFGYQRCLLIFSILLCIVEVGCIELQSLLTMHCVINIKFPSTSLDYSYWSAIIAAIGTIDSILLLTQIFVWFRQQQGSTRVGPMPIMQHSEQRNRFPSPVRQSERHNRVTSPIDPVVLDDFQRQTQPSLYHIYSNAEGTRRFHIQRQDPSPNRPKTSIVRPQNLFFKTSERGTQT